MERLRGYYLEGGLKPDVFESVLACRPARPLDFDRRLHAVSAFRTLNEGAALSAANKRIRNILRQTQEPVPEQVDPQRLTDPAERALAAGVAELSAQVAPLLARGDYTQAMTLLAALREPVDRFFDSVMVMTDDAAVRTNRLALLTGLSALFLQVADLSRLQG